MRHLKFRYISIFYKSSSVQAITFDFFKKITLQISMMAYMKSLTKMVQIQILYQSINLLLVH